MRFQDPLGIRSVPDGGEMQEGHLPVLANEVIEMLAPVPGSLHIDATLGGGGHTERILEAANPDGRLLGREILLAMYIHVAHHRGHHPPLKRVEQILQAPALGVRNVPLPAAEQAEGRDQDHGEDVAGQPTGSKRGSHHAVNGTAAKLPSGIP
jgi:hypothetical protein